MGTLGQLYLISRLRRSSGFTVVELLIVIVVIGILASVISVGYTGVTQSAQTTAITSELEQWHKLFKVYKAENGSYPLPVAPPANPASSGGPGTSALTRYCLGTGFPASGGSNWCFVVSSSSIYRVAESTGSYLMAQLSTAGTLPSNTTKYVYGTVTGPFLRYVSVTDVRLGSVYPPGTTCPSGMILEYSDSNRVDCFIRLNYS